MSLRNLARRSLVLARPLVLAPALAALCVAACIAPQKVETQDTASPAAAAAAPVDEGPPPPQPGATLEPVFDEFDKLDESIWRPSDNWANGALFRCGWRKDNAVFA